MKERWKRWSAAMLAACLLAGSMTSVLAVEPAENEDISISDSQTASDTAQTEEITVDAAADTEASGETPDIVHFGTCGENLTWTLDSAGTLIISGTGEMEKYTIDTEVPWSEMREQIRTVIVRDGVTTISRLSFANCENLTAATLADSVTSIGAKAFFWCINLRSLILSQSLTEIGEDAFEWCSSLEHVTLPEGLQEIGTCCFQGSGLKEVSVPDSVTTMDEAFWRCEQLVRVKLGNGITELNAFTQCSNLTEISIPETVQVIGLSAFDGCASLKELHFPTSVSEIQIYAMKDCTALEKVTIDNPDCEIYLQADTISDTAVIVGTGGSTAQVYAEQLGRTFLDYETGEETAYNPHGSWGENIQWDICDGVLTISGTGAIKNEREDQYIWNQSSYSALVIKEGITEIGPYAFNYAKITEVELPTSLRTIGEYAFRECKQLKTVIIPEGTEIIEKYAFSTCTNLTKLVLPMSMKELGNCCFFNCVNLTEVSALSPDMKCWANSFIMWKNGEQCDSIPISAHYTVAWGSELHGWARNKEVDFTAIGEPFFDRELKIKQAENRTNAIRLYWDVINNCSFYDIYCAEGSGKWKKVKTAKSRMKSNVSQYMSVDHLKNGQKYRFQIVVREGDQTQRSQVVTAYRLKRAVITKIGNVAPGQAKIRWMKNNAADGYEIQWCKDGTFSKDSTKKMMVSGGQKKDKTISGLTKETYEFRVRAYKKVNGKYYYSAWSRTSKRIHK